jgi:hypothetical protein
MAGPGPGPGPGGTGSSTFPLLELLERLPGVFADMLRHLQQRHLTALALACRALRSAAAEVATRLTLHHRACCRSRGHNLHEAFPHISALVMRPGNLHELMFVLPNFFLKVRAQERAVVPAQHGPLPCLC